LPIPISESNKLTLVVSSRCHCKPKWPEGRNPARLISSQHRWWRLDRLGRTAKGLTALFDDLIRWMVNLISLKDGLDLSAPAGRLMANILAGVAAYETEVRAERILAGQQAARARGVTWGGSKKGRRLKVSEEQVQTILRLKSECRKIAAIARATGLSRPTVYNILKTEAAVAA
jgi:DNA invertase Pin-like site-specific DNA recombinase